ncbi:WXG100 family type VII secretion target [Brevibacillus daliensis]|uniref:WXG100 family type VII secretion target n=1 Tax=Brevibacillus daliensis TaxID=2892995 RepID=UPI001E614B02|nr:WXG100 family type VII secretion target [Brevibacillus daliensis]
MGTRLLITPEQIRGVSDQFRSGRESSEQIINRLTNQMTQMNSQWEGMTSQRFYQEFEQSKVNMQYFIILLESIQEQLKEIAHRFETVDQNSPAIMQGSLGLALGLAGTAALGEHVRNQPGGFKGIDKNWEAYLAQEKGAYGFYGKAVGAEAGVYIPGSIDKFMEDFSGRKFIGGEASFVGVEGGIEGKYGNSNVTIFDGEAKLGLEGWGFVAGAEVSVAKYSGELNIPLPFTDKELVIGGEAALGTIGAEVEVNTSGASAYLGIGPYGLGGKIAVE